MPSPLVRVLVLRVRGIVEIRRADARVSPPDLIVIGHVRIAAGASDRDRVLMMMVRAIPVIPMKQDDAGDDVRSDGGLRLAYVR